MQLTMPFQ